MEIVKITWIDAQRLELGCQDKDEMKSIQPIECEIVGFKVDEDDKRIVIAQEKWEETGQIKYVHVIPKVSIIKIQKLREVKNGRTRNLRASVKRNRTKKETKRN